MHNSPVAMPGPYGYLLDKDYRTCDHEEAKEFHKNREENTIERDIPLEEYFANLHKIGKGLDKDFSIKSTQVGGDHYQKSELQPWDIFLAWGLDPWSANVVKYILRFPHKNGMEDLRKARHYIEFLISHYDEVHEKYYEKE